MAFENLVRAVLSNATNWTFTKAAAPFRVPASSGIVMLIDSEQQISKAEYIAYTGLTDNGSTFTLTGVTRAQEGSAQESWTVGAILLQPSLASLMNKLNGIEANATKNANDAQLRDRTTHTGTQPASTIAGLESALEGKASLSGASFTGGVGESSKTITSSGGSLVADCSMGNDFVHALTENTTITLSNAPGPGTAYALTLTTVQDSTVRTITWPASVGWAGGSAPTLSSGAGEVDVFVLKTHDGGTTWFGFTSGQAMS